MIASLPSPQGQYHQSQWLYMLITPAPYGLIILQSLGAYDIVLLRSVHRTFSSITHEAAAFTFNTVWCPLSLTEVVDVMHADLDINNIDKDGRISFPYFSRAVLSCPFNSYSTLLSSLRSVDLSNVYGMQDTHLNTVLQRCSGLTVLDMTGAATENLTPNCVLFCDPSAVLSSSSLTTLHFAEQVDESKMSCDELSDTLQFNVKMFPHLTSLHHAQASDDMFDDDVSHQVPSLRSLTIGTMHDIDGSVHSHLLSLTELNMYVSSETFDDVFDTLGKHLKLSKLFVQSDLYTNCVISKDAIIALLGQHSSCHNTLEELELSVDDGIHLESLFDLSAQLPLLRSLQMHCDNDIGYSTSATNKALYNLLRTKRGQLHTLHLPNAMSTYFLAGDILTELLIQGGPFDLHVCLDASIWNNWSLPIMQKPGTDCHLLTSLSLEQQCVVPERRVPFALQSLQYPCFTNLMKLSLDSYPFFLPSHCVPGFKLSALHDLQICVSYPDMMDEAHFVWWGQVAPHLISLRYSLQGLNGVIRPMLPRVLWENLFCNLRELEIHDFSLDKQWWTGISKLLYLGSLIIGQEQQTRTLADCIKALSRLQLNHCADIMTRDYHSFPALMDIRVQVGGVRDCATKALHNIRSRILQVRPYLNFAAN